MSLVLEEDELVIKKDTFGFLVEEFIKNALRRTNYDIEWLDTTIRGWWPDVEKYYQRKIILAIELENLRNKPPKDEKFWKKIVADLRGPKHPFTVDYKCHKCKKNNLKLWRGVHGCADKDGNELLCAACLAPGEKIDNEMGSFIR